MDGTENLRLPIEVRPERPADYEAIGRVVKAAFGGIIEADLVERIRASDRYVPELALVAEEGGDSAIVGHTMLSYATVGVKGEDNVDVLMLTPVAGAPERQRTGIGSALVRRGLELATARREPLVVVQGHPSYYPRFGFERASLHGIEPPSPEIRDEAFMVIRLAAYEDSYRGKIEYQPPFDGI